jgi:gas vesicle protein
MGRFKKGLFLGGLLGATLAWLNTTPKGKKARSKLLKASGDIYMQIKKDIENKDLMKKMNKNRYMKMVNKKVDEYTKKNLWAKEMGEMLVKKLNSKWVQIKRG